MNKLCTLFKILLPVVILFVPQSGCSEKEYPEEKVLHECNSEENNEEWCGEWITLNNIYKADLFLRRDFFVLPAVEKATLYIKSSCDYIVYLNGIEIEPINSFFEFDTIYYGKYDILNNIREKENGIGLYLKQHNEKNSPVISARLKLEYTNRNYQHIRTDYRWMATPLAADIYFDELLLWSQPGHKSKDWQEAREIPYY